MTQSLHVLIGLLLEGDQMKAAAEAHRLLDAGVDRERIVTSGIEEAMKQLDSKCTLEEFNLLEIMLAGRAATEVLRVLFPRGDHTAHKGVVVLGTPKGDVHDLGKNIVKSILVSSGYRVIDCGKDVPPERLVEAAEREKAMAIGVSGLVTTTLLPVRQLRPMLAGRGVQCLLLAGGAALALSSEERLDVDHVARDAFEGVHFLNQRLGQ